MNVNQQAETAAQELVIQEINHVGVVTLNRPKAHNALTHAMVLALTERLSQWKDDPAIYGVVIRGAGDRAFCAGGDIRALYQSYRDGSPLYRDFFVDEYRLDHMLHQYPKPCVAVMDGLVMGGGMGIAQGAALRVVTSRSQIAMPETAIGLFPDVGASYFLAKMPVELGLYLGITGVTLNAADALFAGLADTFAESNHLNDLDGLLSAITWTREPLADLRNAIRTGHRADSGRPSLEALMPAIQHHFDPARSIGQVIDSLDAERDPRYGEWASTTAETLRQRSPLMMCVTREQLLRGRHAELADCFRMELGMVYRAFDDGDVIEGIRALLIDKDKAPRWRAATVDEVTQPMVSRFFDSPWSRDGHPLRDLA
ncbi:enoyl-CoA hydratase/isomerase family protein [Paraburkholderia xenovorans LB400]|uniref:Enoyl-CoA hydratase/isomerase n=1 Tax=Paraburkholderia xenovorans (strain LB400) TaxID=266265 RepID=Q13IB6_PARXL|nr:enoyl-CoA hydratase/isomerase family protein [Paraburkholderia xenovorans]ABE36173.1 Putative enoyl-CoA hydratase/isomerase [Paraburkholderia xenovorans LB400]AIP34048.1 enoyl-CoA hydratase/isomerase family protein [Paraburkholderia xenovorans LB400]